MAVKRICLLGATGSIGASTLAVIRRHPDRYALYAATGNRRLPELLAICDEFDPALVVAPDDAAAEAVQAELRRRGLRGAVLAGVDGLAHAASHPQVDQVMAAIVGAAGLPPTLAAARAGKRILLANKEALVMARPLLMHEAQAHGAMLLPVDSEHNAIFQCMPGGDARGPSRAGVARIVLTASGGPFRDAALADLAAVTPAQAVAHPNWRMGRKISVDSATLMNKGLELIEARWLFSIMPQHIDVVVHRQSVIHSMVMYADGSMLAQLGAPDMRIPIAHAMAYPDRIESGAEMLDLCAVSRLDFEAPDVVRFPALRLAREAAEAGGAAPAVLNAANEVAVAAFLAGGIGFMDIPNVVARALHRLADRPAVDLAAMFDVDAAARRVAAEAVAALAR